LNGIGPVSRNVPWGRIQDIVCTPREKKRGGSTFRPKGWRVDHKKEGKGSTGPQGKLGDLPTGLQLENQGEEQPPRKNIFTRGENTGFQALRE